MKLLVFLALVLAGLGAAAQHHGSYSSIYPTINGVGSFEFLDANGNVILSIDSTNIRVGVNTATPGGLLDLGQDTGNKFRVWSSSGANYLGLGVGFLQFTFNLDQPGTRYAFFDDEALSTELFTILGTGNVGIGDVSPDVALDVIGQFTLSPIALASLGTPADGTQSYCSDCLRGSAPCTGASTGAFAKRENGAWNCD